MSSSEDELSHFKPSGLLYSNSAIQDNRNSHNTHNTHNTLNTHNSLKYFECEDACNPRRHSNSFKLFIFKDKTVQETVDLSLRSYFRLGRDDKLNQIPLLHQSVSSQHAVLQYRLREGRCRLYLMDLDSSNGTRINGETMEAKRFYEILDGDVVNFGASTRDFVFMKSTQ